MRQARVRPFRSPLGARAQFQMVALAEPQRVLDVAALGLDRGHHNGARGVVRGRALGVERFHALQAGFRLAPVRVKLGEDPYGPQLRRGVLCVRHVVQHVRELALSDQGPVQEDIALQTGAAGDRIDRRRRVDRHLRARDDSGAAKRQIQRQRQVPKVNVAFPAPTTPWSRPHRARGPTFPTMRRSGGAEMRGRGPIGVGGAHIALPHRAARCLGGGRGRGLAPGSSRSSTGFAASMSLSWPRRATARLGRGTDS